MKINFLGTSHGVPAADRYCQSIMIETNGAMYLIDAGAPVIDLLLRNKKDLNSLKAVFITHCHGDHIHGLLPLADLAGWYFKEMSFRMFLPEKNVADNITSYLESTSYRDIIDGERLRIAIVGEGTVFEDENIKVVAYPTNHMQSIGRPAFGYLIEAEGKKVYISGDLNRELNDFPQLACETELDAFIVECAHFPAEKLIENLKAAMAKRVLVTHVFPLDKYDALNAWKQEAHFELLFPCDGETFEI